MKGAGPFISLGFGQPEFRPRNGAGGSDLDETPLCWLRVKPRSRCSRSRRDAADRAWTSSIGPGAKIGAGERRKVAQIRALSATFGAKLRLIEV